MITIKTCTVCSLVATEDAIGHSCRSSDNRKVSRDPLSTKLGMQPDCIIHLLSFRNWRPTGSFWRMMVDGEFLISLLVCSFNQRDPFLWLLPVVEDMKKGHFLDLLFRGDNLYVFVLFIQENPQLIRSYWEIKFNKSPLVLNPRCILMPIKAELIPFLLHMDKYWDQKICFYKEMMKLEICRDDEAAVGGKMSLSVT